MPNTIVTTPPSANPPQILTHEKKIFAGEGPLLFAFTISSTLPVLGSR